MATHVALPPQVILATSPGIRDWQPRRPVLRAIGKLYLSNVAQARIDGDWTGFESLHGKSCATFDDFVENGRPPYGLFKATFGKTGVAQMEILAPRPGVRLFGAFVAPDVFVGLHLARRDELPFKATGQKGLIDYKGLGEALVAEWDALLPGVPRLNLKDL